MNFPTGHMCLFMVLIIDTYVHKASLLRNPFPTMDVLSGDQIADVRATSLRILEDLGIKIMLPEARKIFAKGGARVDETREMVYIGRDMVEAALETAPPSINCRTGARDRVLIPELGALAFPPGAKPCGNLSRNAPPKVVHRPKAEANEQTNCSLSDA